MPISGDSRTSFYEWCQAPKTPIELTCRREGHKWSGSSLESPNIIWPVYQPRKVICYMRRQVFLCIICLSFGHQTTAAQIFSGTFMLCLELSRKCSTGWVALAIDREVTKSSAWEIIACYSSLSITKKIYFQFYAKFQVRPEVLAPY